MADNLILQVGVKILLQNQAGKYLLLRRSLLKYPDIKGRWDIVGGRIEPGTNLIQNLQREVDEETKLKIIGEPKIVAAQDILRKPGHHIVRLTYLGKVEGKIELDASENDAYQWLSLSELKALEDVDMYLQELLNNPTVLNID